MNHTLSRWLACGACTVGAVAFAQEPAARLLPARPVDPPPPAVVRAAPPPAVAPPGYQFQPPAAVPAPGISRQPIPQPQPAQPRPSLFDGLPDGVKAAFGGKPADEPAPWWPTTDPRQAAQPAKATAAPSAPPPGVYAGPPAYRWYGYGTPAPGTNPYAPTGRYPQASASWYTQTGATPGAFPTPVGGGPLNPADPPVVVQSIPQEPPRSMVFRDPPPSRPVSAEPSRSADRREPAMPTGNGVPVAVDPSVPEVSWLPAGANSRVPIAATTAAQGGGQRATDPLPVPVSAQPPTEPPADWGPSRRQVPADAPLPTVTPLPAVTLIRGQAPAQVATAAEVDGLIRTACFGRASRVEVERPGPQRLHVKLLTPTEADAKEAAGLVSRLPELKAYTVTFEAAVGR